MFARTFAVYAKTLDLDDPAKVIEFIGNTLRSDFKGRRAFRFLFFADCDRELKKIVFYDMSYTEHVIEFSSLLARLPEYSIACDGKEIKVHYFHEERAMARVFHLREEGPVVGDLLDMKEESEKETTSLKAVASMTHGFLDAAIDLQGSVLANVFEDPETKERYAYFTVKLDASSKDNRAIIRSCEKMYFAWSDTDANYMIFLCRFKMLPPFAMSFPILSPKERSMAAAKIFMTTKKGVGMVVFSDDNPESFSIADSKPTFEAH